MLATLICGLAGPSCSTLADAETNEPVICEFCDVGEQELKCNITGHLDGMPFGTISDSAYVCLDPTATDDQKEQACIDSCEEYIAGNVIGLYCDFSEGEEPFRWSNCVPPGEPTGGVAGMGYECPGWYAPSTRIINYEQQSQTQATLTIERSFIDDLRADILASNGPHLG